jgi:hypothetical protein
MPFVIFQTGHHFDVTSFCYRIVDEQQVPNNLKVVTNEKGEAVGDVLTIIC